MFFLKAYAVVRLCLEAVQPPLSRWCFHGSLFALLCLPSSPLSVHDLRDLASLLKCLRHLCYRYFSSKSTGYHRERRWRNRSVPVLPKSLLLNISFFCSWLITSGNFAAFRATIVHKSFHLFSPATRFCKVCSFRRDGGWQAGVGYVAGRF